MKKIRFGTVGIQGFSKSHIGNIRRAAEAGHPVELAAVFAYKREENEELASELESAGIKLVASYEELLSMKSEIDCITLPVGIPLHASMGKKALEAGFHVYLEKPVAGAIQDADVLAKAEEDSGKKLFIGYQHCFQPSVWELKRRILRGDIGTLEKITLVMQTPRDREYFKRNSWAGKLSVNGTIVLDSPLNNANAHYMNLALFLACGKMDRSALPRVCEAELYRANDIESADTVSVWVGTEEDKEIVWTGSHACGKSRGPRIRIEGSKKTVSIDYTGPGRDQAWREGEGADGPVFVDCEEGFVSAFVQSAKWLNGDRETPVCDMKIARSQTLVVNGVHTAAPVTEIPGKYIEEKTRDDGDILRVVEGMDEALDACYEKGCLLHYSGCVPWSVKPSRAGGVSKIKNFKLPDFK